MGLVEPSESRRVEHLQQFVDPQIEPRGRPRPQKERAHEQHRDRQHEHHHWASRAFPGIHGHAGVKDDEREPHRQDRHEVARRGEGAPYFLETRPLEDVVEKRGGHGLPQHQHDEAADHGEESPPHVLGGRHRGGMQEHVHFHFAVAQERKPRRRRHEERVVEQYEVRHRLRLRELGGDPRLGAADLAVAGRDRHLAAGKPEGGERQHQRQRDEQRPPEGVPELDPERGPQPSDAHRNPSVRAPAPTASWPGNAPRRMSTRYASSSVTGAAENPAGGAPVGLVDARPVAPLHQQRLGHGALGAQAREVGHIDDAFIDVTTDRGARLSRCRDGQQAPFANDREARAQHGDVLDDVRGEQHDAVHRQLGEQLIEPQPLLRVQAGGGFVHYNEARVPGDRLRDAQSLAHAAGVTLQRTLGRKGEVHALEQFLHQLLASLRRVDALEGEQMRQHCLPRKVRIEAEFLREIAETRPQRLGIVEDIHPVEGHAARRRFQESRQNFHEGGLPRAVGPEEPEHAGRNVEVDAIEGGDGTGIDLGKTTGA